MARILVVDDDPSVLKLIAAVLGKDGHDVMSCSSGSAALVALGIRPLDPETDPPELIILDIMMPKIDGYSLAKTIREHRSTRRIPLVVVSALRDMSRLFTATVQVDGFLRKPFSPDELIACVRKALYPPQPAPRDEADGRRHD
ncbi:MAG: response regulator [Elusimicrobia bacterium]|nr:response regulator [Elusimicrobiota bacterium]